MKLQIAALKKIEAELEATGKPQISLTDPDARSMITQGSGIVGYNVQTAVDAKHHLIVEHEVTNIGNRDQLSGMAKKARTAIGTEPLTAIADRSYFKGDEIWRGNKLVLPCWCRRPRHPTLRSTADSSRLTSSMTWRRTSTVARRVQH